MTTIPTTTNANSVYSASGPYIAEEPVSCGAVGATTPTGSCSANGGSSGSGTKSAQSASRSSSGESSGASGSNFFSDLLGGVLNLSGGSGMSSLLSSLVPGLGSLMTGLKTIFKSVT